MAHTLTKESVNEIARRLAVVRNNRFGGGGAEDAGDGDQGRGPWLGKTQVEISPGQTAGVNFWTGPKGQETDSGITVQVYLRPAFTSNAIGPNVFVIFDLIDQGYEITVANPCG